MAGQGLLQSQVKLAVVWRRCVNSLSNSALTNQYGRTNFSHRIKDFIEVDKPFEDLQDRTKLPRMPWHDIHSR